MKLPPYSAHEEQVMRRPYPHMRAADVARAMGRGERSVHRKASAMGLRKTAAFYASWASGRLVAAQMLADLPTEDVDHEMYNQ